jgi:DNA-binding Lrp family transcriptional regulator
MSVQLDDIDVRIVEMLQVDARVAYKEVAQKIGVSLPTVRSRINKLVEHGVIKKFTVIVDPDRIYGKVRGFILLQVQPAHVEEAMTRLAGMKEVREIYMTAGSNPITVKVEVRDLDELSKLASRKFSEVEGVIGCSYLVITRTGKEEYGASVEPQTMIQFKCEFCGAPIFGKPYIEYIDGGRYYFNAEECAMAYKQKLLHTEEQSKTK